MQSIGLDKVVYDFLLLEQAKPVGGRPNFFADQKVAVFYLHETRDEKTLMYGLTVKCTLEELLTTILERHCFSLLALLCYRIRT